MLTPARLAAVVIFATAMLSLRAQFDVSQALMGNASGPAVLWRMLGYFTVLTNGLVALAMVAIALRWQIGAPMAAALVLSIGMVGLIYHLLLAGLWAPQGKAWWADQGLHTATPVLVAGWWLLFAPKAITLKDMPIWLIWPAAYCLYALIRGAMTGFWAYPFLDASAAGWAGVAVNLVAMLAGFAAMGAGLVVLARRLA